MGELSKDPNQDDPSKNKSSIEKKEEGVIDELRRLISDLKPNESPAPEETESQPQEAAPAPNLEENVPSPPEYPSSEKQIPEMEPDPLLGDAPDDSEQKMGDAGIPPEGGPPPQEKLNSDEEFWSGNVLGWPSGEPESEVPAGPKLEMEDSGTATDQSVAADKPEKLTDSFPETETKPEEPPIEKLNVEAINEDNVPSDGEDNPISAPEGGAESLEELFPAAPVAPIVDDKPGEIKEPESPEPDVPKSNGDLDMFENTLENATREEVPVDDPPASLPVESVPPESKEPIPEEIPIPIPGTVEDLEKPHAKPAEDAGLSLEADNKKPEGVFQVACFFPEGEEKKGRLFVSKLRDAGSRNKKKMDIQAVYVQGWKKDEIFVKDWESAAALSGSQYTFILVARKEQNLFQEQISNARNKTWKGRVLLIEQVAMRSLYADIVIKLGREA